MGGGIGGKWSLTIGARLPPPPQKKKQVGARLRHVCVKHVCVCVYAIVYVRACVRACVRAGVRARDKYTAVLCGRVSTTTCFTMSYLKSIWIYQCRRLSRTLPARLSGVSLHLSPRLGRPNARRAAKCN